MIFEHLLFLSHQPLEIHRIGVSSKVVENFLQFRVFLFDAELFVDANLLLHLGVVVVEISLHFSLELLVVRASLVLNLFNLLDFSEDVIFFFLLNPLHIFLLLRLVHVHGKHFIALVPSHPSKMDVAGVSKPNIVAVVLEELSVHLEHLQLFGLFDIVTHLQALFAAVVLVTLGFEKLKVVGHFFVVIKDLLLGGLGRLVVERRQKFDLVGYAPAWFVSARCLDILQLLINWVTIAKVGREECAPGAAVKN